MRCRKARKLIAARSDGELTDDRVGQVESHLQACASCRAFADQMSQLAEDLQAYVAPEVRPGFTDRLMGRVGDGPSAMPLLRRGWIELLRPAPVVLGAAAFACGVMVPLLANGQTQTTDAVVAASSVEYDSSLATDAIEERLLALLPEAPAPLEPEE